MRAPEAPAPMSSMPYWLLPSTALAAVIVEPISTLATLFTKIPSPELGATDVPIWLLWILRPAEPARRTSMPLLVLPAMVLPALVSTPPIRVLGEFSIRMPSTLFGKRSVGSPIVDRWMRVPLLLKT